MGADHWMICDLCGFKYRRSQMRKNYRNQWVCAKDYEERHPLDRPLGRSADRQKAPDGRPEPADVFVTLTVEEQKAAL